MRVRIRCSHRLPDYRRCARVFNVPIYAGAWLLSVEGVAGVGSDRIEVGRRVVPTTTGLGQRVARGEVAVSIDGSGVPRPHIRPRVADNRELVVTCRCGTTWRLSERKLQEAMASVDPSPSGMDLYAGVDL